MRAGVAAGLVIALITGHGGAAAAQSPADSVPPAPIYPPADSVERIRKALERPGLQTDPGTPTFKVFITQDVVYSNPFDVRLPSADRGWAEMVNSKIGTGVTPIIAMSAVAASMAGDGSMSAKPVVLMNVLAIGTMVAGAVGRARHTRRVRKTKDRVRAELEEFCAANGCAAPGN